MSNHVPGPVRGEPPRCLPVFVYGTLKRGQIRESMWPRPPLRVWEAWTTGLLYALPHYPAMREGAGRVGGELWFLSELDMKPTLEALDLIEGYSGSEGDLYVRRVVEAFACDDSQVHLAYTYFYNRPEVIRDLKPIAASADGCSYWPTT